MSNVNGLGTGPTPTLYPQTDRAAWLADEAKIDQQYDEHLNVMKNFETLSKAELKHSANPDAVMMRLKLSDHERSILADVAEINGWSRQSTEATFKMFIAGPEGNSNSISGFLTALTQNTPGYFGDDGARILGLTEADRRRILNIPAETPSSVGPDDVEVVEASLNDVPLKTDTEKNLSSVLEAINKKLTDDEHAKLSEAAQLNGMDEQSAVAYYKMYLAKNSEPSLSDFLQLLAQNEPDSYGKDGNLKHSESDQNQVIRVTV